MVGRSLPRVGIRVEPAAAMLPSRLNRTRFQNHTKKGAEHHCPAPGSAKNSLVLCWRLLLQPEIVLVD